MTTDSENLLGPTMRSAKGNVPQSIKDSLAEWYSGAADLHRFAAPIARRLEATEMSVYDKTEEPGKKEAKMVFEIDVTEDMCNFGNSVHGGCSAFLIDLCSSLAISLLATQEPKRNVHVHVSLVLNTTYHAPAPLGCRLKIVNTTMALGGRVMTARAEIYDITHNRLVASGVHIKMPPSAPKL
ncbi:hypothetical protein PHLCEN_2v7450 [Hermanssonia centrifuga]|uniref:Thioesterase domain-containing protein n=1 Tax=Hermanssonia centrifuga TaxID=98765 RepID=A0A2R6NWM7_9APHY|nr:hypothetical protein PHLCEN_2v7450 [Hermanssonia centrifuga]